MQIVLDKLVSDHVYFKTLLTDLNQEVKQLGAVSRNSLERLLMIFNEFRGAVPLQHHRLEDAVFDLLKSCNGVADFMIASLERDHVRLDTCSRSIERLLRHALVNLDASSYGKIQSDIAEFIGYYRNHLRMEEETIFPLIENLSHSVNWRTDVDCILRMSTTRYTNSDTKHIFH